VKQLICPMAFNRKSDMVCLEENCAWWVEKGTIETAKTDAGMMTTHTPTGCCAVKAMANGQK